MSAYHCSTCGVFRDDEICPVCLEPTRHAVPAEAPVPPPPPDAATSATPAAVVEHEPSFEPAPAVRPHPAAAVVAAPAASRTAASTPARRQAETIIPQARQRELQQYVDDGYEVFLIAGVAGAGKTELLGAYRQDAFLDRIRRRDGRALPTPPKHLDCLPVHMGNRKVVFVDASGEDLQRLHPKLRPTGEIDESAVDFLRLIGRRLGGVVLLLHLGRLWGPGQHDEADRAQVEIATWILMLLRYFQAGRAPYDPTGAISFAHHVDREVRRLERRLRVPVLTLFSMADELVGVPVPESGGAPTGRTLDPIGEHPLLVAHHGLPGLVEALRVHATHFRFDFVHSLVTDPDTGVVVDREPWGVSPSLAWLLDDTWRRRWPSVPTRVWIDCQRWIDERLLRRRRWTTWPDAEALR